MVKGQKYKGQALALVMAFLVISIVVIIAVASRSMKDREMELIQQTDEEITGLLEQYSRRFTNLNNTLLFQNVLVNKTVSLSNYEEINQYFSILEDYNSFSPNTGSCSPQEIIVRANLSLVEDHQSEIQNSKTLNYTIDSNSLLVKNNCALDFRFDTRGVEYSSFLIHKIYAKNYPQKILRTPTLEDMHFYCLSQTGSCNNLDLTKSWEYIDNTTLVSTNLFENSNGYTVDGLRIVPLQGDLAVNASLSSDNCAGNYNPEFVKVQLEVICKKNRDNKEIYIPNTGYLTYTSIFDYTIYKELGIQRNY